MQCREKFRDISEVLPNLEITTIFDIGANVGDTVDEVLREFPRASVHAFEPVGATFAKLSSRYASNARVKCHDYALGSVEGSVTITARGTATGNRIVTEAGDMPVENVIVRAGDNVLAELGVTKVSFMKIDTEGFDLETLKGFEKSLSYQNVDVFQVEVGMGPQNTKHIPLSVVNEFAVRSGYWLFKLYNQVQEKKGKPVARRADAVFISDAIASQNQRAKHKPLLKSLVPGFLR